MITVFEYKPITAEYNGSKGATYLVKLIGLKMASSIQENVLIHQK